MRKPLPQKPGVQKPSNLLERLWRASLQPSALLSLEDVVKALPCPSHQAGPWLQAHVRPTAEIAGTALYSWSRVLEALAASGTEGSVSSWTKADPPGTVLVATALSEARLVAEAASEVCLEQAHPETPSPEFVHPKNALPETAPQRLQEPSGEAWISMAEAASRLGVARTTLDEMVARAPRTLPGSPLSIGSGRHRRHKRWEATMLESWLVAYRAWSATDAAQPVSVPAPGPLKRSVDSRVGGFRRGETPSSRRSPALLTLVSGEGSKKAGPGSRRGGRGG